MSALIEPSDTSPEAARIQVELLRNASVARRLRLAWSLSATVIGAARLGLRRRQLHASSDDLAVRFAELHYGRELAEALSKDLARRRAPRDT